MKRLVWIPLLIFAACAPRSERPAATSLQPIQQRPAWLKEGIVMAGNWEPLSFIRRRGGHSIQDEETWFAERTEPAARKLKEQGINLVITNLHKGAGLQAEAEEIDATRRFARFAHQHGVRVGGYIGASMFYETFFAEEPGAKEWMQVTEFGRPVYYGGAQTFRYMACRNNPGYRRFLEKVLRLGIQDIGLDLIHFDQMQSWAEPNTCRCRHCAEQFQQFVRTRYTAEQFKARYGFPKLDLILPPAFDLLTPPVRLPSLVNPLMQDWVFFRAWSLARRYAEYDRFIQSLNPQVALEGNPNLNAAPNKGFVHGIDPAQLLEHGDVVWSEEPNHASWTPDGRLISKIRSFKSARIMGKSIFMYTGGRYGTQDPASPPELRIAEAMAYNGVNIGMVGDVSPDGVALTAGARRYIDFFRSHVKDLADTSSAADVAVLRAFASIEFNPSVSNTATVLFEQSLIQSQIPFDIIFERHLKDLSKYKVLVLADQDALSDAEVELIRNFVRNGGGLVATGTTSALTDWRIERRRPALADLFESGGTFGKGRVAYIRRVEPVLDPPPAQMSYNFSNQYWRLPKNARELVEAVRKVAGRPLAASIKAPPSVAAEVAFRPADGLLLLHLVNFDLSKTISDVESAVRLPAGYRLRSASLESPDESNGQPLQVSVKEGLAGFRVPRLKIYGIAALRLEKEGAATP